MWRFVVFGVFLIISSGLLCLWFPNAARSFWATAYNVLTGNYSRL